jgi:hypothetical protein
LCCTTLSLQVNSAVVTETRLTVSQIHASTMNYDPRNVIRVGTDLRFVDASKPWDKVSKIFYSNTND